jgi:putative DNA primase/helicase
MMESIPKSLISSGKFCLWKYIDDRKIPFSVDGECAKSNDESTFSSYEDVMSKLGDYTGIGVGLFNGLSAIDIDDCIDDAGVISDRAKDVISMINSYTEISPSGHGVHILFWCHKPFDSSTYYLKNSPVGIEIYIGGETNRFMTLTGNRYGDCEMLREPDLGKFLDKYMRRAPLTQQVNPLSRALSKDAKLSELWNAKAPGSGADESERDMALCCKLAFYCGADSSATDRAFRSSPYYLSKDKAHVEKWEKRDDYREQTLSKACSLVRPNISYTGEYTPASGAYLYTLDDTGNAKRFVKEFGSNIRWNTDNNTWMIWDGKRWENDTTGKAKSYLDRMTAEMQEDYKQGLSDEPSNIKTLQPVAKNISYLRSHRGKENCLAEAQHLEGMPVNNSCFDSDGWQICTDSGVVNLRTGEVVPCAREQMMSKSTDCEIDMTHEPTQFLAYLKDILRNHPELLDYVHRLFGYAMTDSLREQQMYFLYGDGNDGKSLLLDVIGNVLGEYSWVAKSSLLTEQYNDNKSLTQIALLKGKRFISVEELKADDRLDESLVKDFTSGLGEITGKFLYANEFNFHFYGKIFMATNYKPIIRGTDNGIWRRIIIIPFDRALRDDEVDKDLKEKLLREKPQILGWLVNGCLDYQKNGLVPPACVKAMTQDYRTEQDRVLQWIDERCERGDSYYASASELFRDFTSWCINGNEYKMSQTMFGRSMGKKFTKRQVSGARIYYGLRLRGDNEDLSKAKIAKDYDDTAIDESDI